MRRNANGFIILLVMLISLVLGGIIGDVFSSSIPILSYGKAIGFDPVTIDLSILKLVIGFKMQINLAGIIGLLIGLFIFKRFRL